jgi:REP element-mobilizing transposase RayT
MGSRAPRLRDFDYVGLHRYSLTMCTHGRARRFTDADSVRVVVTALAASAAQQGFEIPVYCAMPDHMHVLGIGSEATSDVRELVRLFKQRSAFGLRRLNPEPVWQRSYWDRVLRENEPTLTVARYILANPVRAGLVDDARAYPFSGSLTLEREELFRSAFEMPHSSAQT